MSDRSVLFFWLRRQQHFLLIALLVTLHTVSAVSPETPTGNWLWMVNVGLFLLWQPFVGGDERLKPEQAVVVLAAVFVLVWQLGWGWLAVWHAFLAALVGGKVVMARGARHRWFYLLAFAYLVGAMLVWVSPNVVPHQEAFTAIRPVYFHFAALILFAAIVVVRPREEGQRAAELHDFLASLLVLLLLAVLLLGTITLMTLRVSGFYDALVMALLGAGASLLMLSWAWNPRPGFGGLGAAVSRYLLRIGLDFDQWLTHQLDLAENEDDAGRFLSRSLEAFADLPWVAGGEWRAYGASGRFGEPAKHATEITYQNISLRLFTPYAWTTSLVWQASLLLKLAVELHEAKAREDRLRQMEYLQAVHETGARLTHDMKNVLQAMGSLCYAAENTPDADAAALADLIRRQLPALGQRLRTTLDKLERPQVGDESPVAAGEWWAGLQGRFAGGGIEYLPLAGDPGVPVTQSLFDSVADNLLANVLYKRQMARDLAVRVSLAIDDAGACVLAVEDNGSAIDPVLASELFAGPTASHSGLGIGLFQAARQAEAAGGRLLLAENRPGAVRFELRMPSR